MVPTRLTLSNFMCYRADGQAELPPTLDLDGLHVVCLSGENGAGKSALLDAITWALWGAARTADDDLIAQGQSEMFVELEFDLGDLAYRVRRARQRGGTGKRGGQNPGKSQLDLQVRAEAGWRPIGEVGVRETQAAIDSLLHMSYQTFTNAAFLLQGRADSFTNSTPAERKQVLADILDLAEYEALAARARERARGLADQLTGLRGAIEQLQRQAAEVEAWRALLEQSEAAVAHAEAQAAGAEAECQAADGLLTELTHKAERRKGLLRDLERLRASLAALAHEAAELRARIAQAEGLIASGETIRAGLKALAEARAEVERLGAARRQHDELTRLQAELRQQFAEARAEIRERLRSAEARAEGLALRAARREALRADLAALAERGAAMADTSAEHALRTQERQALAERAERLDQQLRRREALQAQIKLRIDSLVAVREGRREALARLDQQLADEPRWRRELEAARADQLQLAAAEARLAQLRAQEQADVDQVTALRASCQAAHAEGEKLKRTRALLDGEARTCPVCRCDLGAEGVARVHAHYDEELAALRGRYAAAKREADQGEARLKTTRAALADGERALAALRPSAARAEGLEHQLALAAGWRVEAETVRAEYEDLRRQIEGGQVEPAAQADLAAVDAAIAALGDQRELARERARVEERLRELQQRLQERAQLEGKAAAYAEELARIEAELGAAPALQAEVAELRRVLEGNDFAHPVRDEGQRVRAALEALAYSPEAHAAAEARAQELRRWEEQERELALAEQRLSGDRAALEKTLALQQRDEAEAERLAREGALLEQELRELPRAQARAAELQEALKGLRRRLEVARNDRADKAAHVRAAEAAERELEGQRARERALVERQGLFAELAEAFGKKGVQAMLIETAIPQIEDEANRLLGRMTDGQMHLSFEMQRDTKKGDTVETLEIKIADALGTRAYDAFSGGEAMRANFAVRIALSRLLARRAGARLETLVIDEGFGTLDALGRERMVEAITSVQADFRRIIVITHIDELKDRFPAQIEVTKTPLGSRWELR